MKLVELLAEDLDISREQAAGAAGLVFRLAREKLSAEEFSYLAQHVSHSESLIESAPEIAGRTTVMGGLGGLIGGKPGRETDLANLMAGFAKLGVDSGVIAEFARILLSYVQSEAGDKAKHLIERVLR